MSKISHLVTGSTDLTVEMALHDVRNFDLTDVMIIGYQDNELVVRSSHMNRKDALWLLLLAVDHTRGIE